MYASLNLVELNVGMSSTDHLTYQITAVSIVCSTVKPYVHLYHFSTLRCSIPLKPSSWKHYSDVILGAMASQITSLTIVNSTIYSGADQRKHQSSASLAFVRGIHRSPLNSPHERLIARKMFSLDRIIIPVKATFLDILHMTYFVCIPFISNHGVQYMITTHGDVIKWKHFPR